MPEVLDKVMQMQQQGMQEPEINKRLRDEGISPQQINDALNQSQVKTAVSQSPDTAGMVEQPPITQNMQQSIMQNQAPAPQDYPEQPPQEVPQDGQPPTTQTTEQEYYYPESPQAYPEQAYYPEQSALDTETITGIAEQIVSEKLNEFKQKTGNIASFKTETQEELKDLDERLKRIENSINKLQQSIIGKIGEFGESTASVHKDLDNLHNTVSKLMNPLIDNYKELKKITGKETTQSKSKKIS